LAGPIKNQEPRISSLGDLNKFFPPPKVVPSDVDKNTLLSSICLADGIDRMYCNPTEDGPYLRVRKGFNAWVNGLQQRSTTERLHQFVRAVEAVVKPKVGEFGKKFTARNQYFAGKNQEQLLGQLYEMRSFAEHLIPVRLALTKDEGKDFENCIATRTYQAELLAGHVFRKILAEPEILRQFETDDTIDELWALGEKPRTLFELFGDPINLEDAAKRNFHSFLKLR
jgi:hypothetical protein